MTIFRISKKEKKKMLIISVILFLTIMSVALCDHTDSMYPSECDGDLEKLDKCVHGIQFAVFSCWSNFFVISFLYY
jgi:hypothetical protein